MPHDDGLSKLACKNAEDFLHSLALWNPHWGGDYLPEEWLFRGHANAEWDLYPKAFREHAILRTTEGWGKLSGRVANREQICAEFQTVKIFFKLADFSGLPLPEDNQAIRAVLHSLPEPGFIWKLQRGSEGWPPSPLWSLLALAQHHGVPTRLLDWSRRPWTAAYFAAVDAARWVKDGPHAGEENARELAVWALSARAVSKATGTLDYAKLDRPVAILVTAPGAGNANVYAQGGQFTLVLQPAGLDLDRPADRSPQTPVLRKMAALHKITLPIAEAPRLLRLLALENTNGASLFPAYDGVKKAMDERRYWDKEDGLT